MINSVDVTTIVRQEVMDSVTVYANTMVILGAEPIVSL